MPPDAPRPENRTLPLTPRRLSRRGSRSSSCWPMLQEPLSTRAIAEQLGRSKGEIFRMVFVLVERGYLVRNSVTDELSLSNRLFELGMRTPRSRQLMEVAVPAMEHLSEATGQSAHLVVINRGETVVIATAAGGADINFTLRLGYRRPALDATSGQIIIAFQDAARRAQLINRQHLPVRRPDRYCRAHRATRRYRRAGLSRSRKAMTSSVSLTLGCQFWESTAVPSRASSFPTSIAMGLRRATRMFCVTCSKRARTSPTALANRQESPSGPAPHTSAQIVRH